MELLGKDVITLCLLTPVVDPQIFSLLAPATLRKVNRSIQIKEMTRTSRVFYKEYTHKPSSASECIFLDLPPLRSLE